MIDTRRLWMALLPLGTLLAVSGCFSAPTPLIPHSHGSVGLPHHGVLKAGQQLPAKGEGFVRFRNDGVSWGAPRLVALLENATRRVADQRPGGAPLVVGDLSARHGGKVPRHRSHRSGRDVDLLFYVTTADGRPIRNPGFLRFGYDGFARHREGRPRWVRFDVERQWLLIRAMLEDPSANVQWLFIARHLEALIVEYARARGEDDELVWRAENLMKQPSDSFSHDDHIHMRVGCTPNEEVSGCRGGGYRWPWFPPEPRLPAMGDEQLLRALLDEPAT
jgi:penicillin-insensitive murein endopeptidase